MCLSIVLWSNPCDLVYAFPGDRDAATTRVAELESALKSESAKSKKLLDEAERCEIDLMQAEKLEVARLLSLAAHVGGKYIIFVFSFVSLIILLFLSEKLILSSSLCRNLRCCSSTRKHL